MPFNNKIRLDPSQVDDRRGRSMGTRVAIGGGGLVLVILVVALLLGVDLNDLAAVTGQVPTTSTDNSSEIDNLEEACQTGADANVRQDCQIVGFVNSIQGFWTDEFASQGVEYPPAKTVLFTGSTQGACGYASAATGPFYCPLDQMVYLDLSFFEELETRFGAEGGAYAVGYILAHEYGHHIQDLAGVLDEVGSQGDIGPQSMSVQIELQADCLAGVWMNNANDTGYLTPLTEDEIVQSLDAASSVGDDRIQNMTQGYVSPESWTHGSSEQRKNAFMIGLNTGDVNACDRN